MYDNHGLADDFSYIVLLIVGDYFFFFVLL